MKDFPRKLDLFTEFAAQKITKHSKEITAQRQDERSVGSENISADHEQLLEKELTSKIQELTGSEELLLDSSLRTLKQYYISMFRSRIHQVG